MFHESFELLNPLNFGSRRYLVCSHGKDYLVKPLHVRLRGLGRGKV